MITIGLTGSIGMGKSTTAELFAARGLPVWDADAAVHRLYAPDGAGTSALQHVAPEAVKDRGVDRSKLKALIAEVPTLLAVIERIVHPMVAEDRRNFMENARTEGHRAVVLDIPLLFETGGNSEVDLVVVVSTDAETQTTRVLNRPGMTNEQFAAILARQVPDADKRAQADLVIETTNMDTARQGVDAVLKRVEDMAHA